MDTLFKVIFWLVRLSLCYAFLRIAGEIWFSPGELIVRQVFLGAYVFVGLYCLWQVEKGLRKLWLRLDDPEDRAQFDEIVRNVSAKSKDLSEDGAAMLKEVTREGGQAQSITETRIIPFLSYVFGFQGRITRIEYLICQLVAGIIHIISIYWLFFEAFELTPLLLLIISTYILLAFGVRRTRDTGVNQWWFLMIFVPPANLAMLLFLLFVPTDEFKNTRF